MQFDAHGTPPLQFETAVPAQVAPTGATGVACEACQRSIVSHYFDINAKSVCRSCHDAIVEQARTPKEWTLLLVAGLFGAGAATAGAVLYYAVIAITNFEIGIVAIAIGYMVGYAVRRGAGGKGGRRFQVVAIVLTYWAVGLAYVPLVLRTTSASQQTAARTTAAAAPAPAKPDPNATGAQFSVGRALLVILGFSFALPILTVATSLPGGILSAIIIGVGIRQAWHMTGVPQLQISGPYRIATDPVVST